MKNAWVIGAMALGLTGGVPVLAADDAADSAAGSGPLGITVQYSGSVMIFQVADIVVNGQFANDDYSASARLTTAGLAALFSDADIEAGVSGYRFGPRLQPWRYSHYNHASSKNRTVGIDFPEGVATPDIEPPFGNMGEPPATAEERAELLLRRQELFNQMWREFLCLLAVMTATIWPTTQSHEMEFFKVQPSNITQTHAFTWLP